MSETIACCPILIGNEWSVPDTAETSPVYNPSTGEQIAVVPMCDADIVDSVVRNAHAALADWMETPPIERARVLFRYKMLLEDLTIQGTIRLCTAALLAVTRQ